ncbi:hypothetical protein ADUPG1_013377, partial [Aduncisulcus paluster]
VVVSFIVLLMLGLVSMMVIGLLIYHSILISINFSTFESIKAQSSFTSYRSYGSESPFSLGSVPLNWLDFIGRSSEHSTLLKRLGFPKLIHSFIAHSSPYSHHSDSYAFPIHFQPTHMPKEGSSVHSSENKKSWSTKVKKLFDNEYYSCCC